ncbi:phosphatase PAP2 family protein [Jatrophihabitans fulvus]
MTLTARPAVRVPLVGRPRAAVAGVAAGVVAFVAMAVWVHDTYRPNAVDRPVADWLWRHFGDPQHPGPVSTFLRWLSEPVLTVTTILVVGVVALVLRAWPVVALVAVGPALGLVLESYVLKPLIGRQFGIVEQLSDGAVKAGWAFPSGHQTGITSLLALLVLLVLRTSAPRAVAVGAVAIASVWAALAALGLVGAGYHYFTDTWGGVILGVLVIVVPALVIDAVTQRVSSPGDRVRPRTPGAA